MTLPRLRQVALVARDLDTACAALEAGLDVKDPFHDPGVGEFGLTNAVYELGDTFLEVVSPAGDGTTAGRYLDRHGGDAGYMALFQVADTPATRRRVETLGIRVVWQLDLPDISGTHLHPKDVPGAIVSVDTPDPPESWRWAGPRWTGGAPPEADPASSIVGIRVNVQDPSQAGQTWAAVLDGLDAGVVTFASAAGPEDEGITEVRIAGLRGPARICGVDFVPA